MARAGDIIDNPRSRERVLFLKTASETDGELLRYECSIGPKGGARAEHARPMQVETIEVISGEARLSIDGRHYAVRAGDAVEIPAGVRRAFWNEGSEELNTVVELRPALKTEMVLETAFGLARDGRSTRGGLPRLMQLAVLVRDYGQEIGGLPRWLDRLCALLAPVAEILGHRSWYPEYSHPATHPGRRRPAAPMARPAGW